ncbi:D-glycero-beta-D-manno-heptose 1,7-bisphosphate 7-phosphatase [Permianibacter aggregans]|uniref:D,D-heptose 1,7-bisphosphate phosphatase n=1 Tax=Permianibacter aggregans TaxID=1510150 RepID=A0A4R6UYR4_9GAMM|nr:D-glycero-beta-D-manno-heptose 1,7-bisphosphate 7-phosphatase [Permianibacter aggregans]TDQ51123.1 D-alpha,beta-D-heptose 1,7-bisphosphate phosphatase [Permianibacter aggregans]
MRYKCVILDRDGVINHDSDSYIKSLEEWSPICGSISAIAELCKLGLTVCVATNQSAVARGLMTEESLLRIHEHLKTLVKDAGGCIKEIHYCPHHPQDNCTCRKPNSGMLENICTNLHFHPSEVLFVGDNHSDYECAKRFGCDFALVLTGKGARVEKLIDKNVSRFLNLQALVTSLRDQGIKDPALDSR